MRKILIGLLAGAMSVWAVNIEITPTVGGVHPFGSTNDFDDHLTYGLRVGVGISDFLIDQIEVGYDYAADVDYKGITTESADFHRIYVNAIKDLHFKLLDNLKFYGLVGLGHEDVSTGPWGDHSSAFAQYGAGAKYYLTDWLALRAEVRHAVKFDHGDSNFFYTLGVVGSFGSNEKPAVAEVAPMPEPEPQPVIQEKPIEITLIDEPIVEHPEENLTDAQKTVLKALELTVNAKRHYNFDFDKAIVLDKDKDVATTISGDLKEFGDIRLLADGHADNKGSKWYNMRLSQIRANAAKKEFEKVGVAGERVGTRAYGEDDPIATNDTPDGRAQNRRTEILFIAPITYFAFNSAELMPDGDDVVRVLADSLKDYDEVNIIAEGHTDSKGSKWYNMKLSQKRADVVKDKLVSYGVDGKRIQAKGYGEEKPIASNDTEEGRAKNRRVDVIFVNPHR
jgi:OOP family OmpA-OmpF porin